MTFRSFAFATWTAVVAGCAQQPPAQTATLDTAKVAAVDSSLIRADKARIQGSENATVWLVMASDFQCPFCKQFHDGAYKQIFTDYVATGKVRLAYLNHPMAAHPHAVVAAEAAMCSGMQSKFWEMHDSLFSSQDRWTMSPNPVPLFDSLAAGLHLQMTDWRSCMSSHKSRPMIDADNARTKAGGVTGTPTFFIANKVSIVGAQPYREFRDSLDAALMRAGAPPAPRSSKTP